MSDLINKKELLCKKPLIMNWLLEREKKGYGTTLGELVDKIFLDIENTPIVYDTEKVADEMIKATKKGVECGVYPQGFIHCLTAISIVKNGGINTECDEESECER